MEPLGDDVRRELRGLGPEAGVGDLAEAWPAAVGPEIARNAWPARVQRDGTLVVHTRDAVWGFELTQRAGDIASRLPGKPVLKFVPGPLPEPGENASDAPDPAPEATLEQAEEAARWAASIEDDELRELVARAARASLARAANDRSV
ncbi:MAG: DUF721 domain-containing protein [Actinobacteria bacterium]|nr:DUF721 domain-containing protein [Actinomycetota bacterium]MBV8562667.1 DUF721 domain-containing protein [Actinomycetota bacterium]